jgi:hypothetical protein
VAPVRLGAKSSIISLVNTQTGKMEPWKTLGAEKGAGGAIIVTPHLSDGSAYAYIYVQVRSEAYAVTGLK